LLVTPEPLSIINLIFPSSSSLSSYSSGVKVNCGVESNFWLIGIISNFLLKSASVCLTAFSTLSSLRVIGSNCFSPFYFAVTSSTRINLNPFLTLLQVK
jgi:hypothetical protein